jgi:hypothetical protein
MNWLQEKIFYASTVFGSSGFLWVGSLLSDGDIRWLYATAAASLLTSGFVSLATRKEADSIGTVIARCGIGFGGGVVLTKVILVVFPSLTHVRTAADTDVIFLAGIATIVSIVSHIFGFSVIKAADDSASTVASRVVDRLLLFLRLKNPKNKDED